MTVHVYRVSSSKKLPGIIMKGNSQARATVSKALRMAAERGKSMLVAGTPVDTGQLKGAWRARTWGTNAATGTVASITNDAPHAGIVERGARPHEVSYEGRAALLRWVKRHFPALLEEEQEKIVTGIAWKLSHHGQKPTYFVRKMLPAIRMAMVAEVQRHFASMALAPEGGTGGAE